MPSSMIEAAVGPSLPTSVHFFSRAHLSVATMRSSLYHVEFLLSIAHIVKTMADPNPFPTFEAAMLHARAPEPTAAPQLRHARDKLFIRQTQDAQTCGFIGGSADNALYCNAGMGCAYFTTDVGAQYFECCATSADGGIDFNSATCFENSACLAYASHSLTISAATSISGTEYCGSASGYCGQTILVASESLSGLFTHYNCEAVSGVTSYAYDAVDTSSGTAATLTGSPTSSSSRSSTTTASSTSATSSTPTESPKSDGGSNAGAIAGGVVGGIAGVAIIGGLIGWLMWKKRKERREADVPEVSVLPSK